MNCICGQVLDRFMRDTLVPGDTSVKWVVRLNNPTIPETEEVFKSVGFWAASVKDAEFYTGQAEGLPTHDILGPDGKVILLLGAHALATV